MSIKGLRSRILVYSVWPWYSTLTIQEQQSYMQKIGCRLRNTTSHTPFFSVKWYEPRAKWTVFKVSHRESCDMGRVLKPSAAPQPFCVALSPSVHWHTHFLYCCALYNLFFLGFRQWGSRADRVVNVNTTIWLPLFWRTWTLATRPHVLAWHISRDYSDCRASDSEMTDRQPCARSVASFFPDVSKIPTKQRPRQRLFERLTPQTAPVSLLLLQPQISFLAASSQAPLYSAFAQAGLRKIGLILISQILAKCDGWFALMWFFSVRSPCIAEAMPWSHPLHWAEIELLRTFGVSTCSICNVIS